VAIASTAEDDLASALRERVPDVIVVDGTSVEESLGELRRRLRPRRGSKEIPTLVLIEEDELARLNPGDGWSDFIVKPLRDAELKTRIKRLLWAAGKARPPMLYALRGWL
jgi:DNA-binding response OmpR family regulator